MRDKSDRYQVQTVPTLSSPKRLGTYLVDAGLLTPDQIKVILNDQQATGMRFGEIVAARGWLKEQTIEWIVQKVVEPERQQQKSLRSAQANSSTQPAQPVPRPQSLHVLQAAVRAPDDPSLSQTSAEQTAAGAKKSSIRREAPISKPLPPVKSTDGDVNWVG